nr:hypothetical protein [Candidatus Freyarchaeota archaeon]
MVNRFLCLRAVVTRVITLAVMTPMSVAVKLFKLSKLIDTKPKIDELKKALKGNVKSWTRDQTMGWYDKVEQTVRFFATLNLNLNAHYFHLNAVYQ